MIKMRDCVLSYGGAHEPFTRHVTPCLPQKQRSGSSERTDEGYEDSINHSVLGLSVSFETDSTVQS